MPFGAIGLIAAAGESRRMGQPKALLELNGISFSEHMVNVFCAAPFSDIMITLPQRHGVQDLANNTRAVIGHNPWPELGVSGSIRWALRHFSAGRMLIVCPVDMPFVCTRLLGKMISALDEGHPRICMPHYQGKNGHPIGFTHHFFDELIEAPNGGPRDIIKKYPAAISRISWPDRRVTCNINTYDDYKLWTSVG